MTRPKFQTRKGPAPRVLAIILAGGEGMRLLALTLDRAKPAVPIGGRYRLIDFVLSNFVNSGIMKIKVLTQFKSNSLIEHITRTWRLVPEIGQYVDIVPAQMRRGPFWFRVTADAVFQNLELIFDEQPEYVCVFGGDHIYKTDVNQMLQEHINNDADLTIATIPVPLSEAHHFGVVEIDQELVEYAAALAIDRVGEQHRHLLGCGRRRDAVGLRVSSQVVAVNVCVLPESARHILGIRRGEPGRRRSGGHATGECRSDSTSTWPSGRWPAMQSIVW